jgi:hypothetical protein
MITSNSCLAQKILEGAGQSFDRPLRVELVMNLGLRLLRAQSRPGPTAWSAATDEATISFEQLPLDCDSC